MAANRVRLQVTQGEPIRFRFRYRESGVARDMREFRPRAQIRTRVGGPLLLDLQQYFKVNQDDNTALELYVPGAVTRGLRTDGVWDVWLDDDTHVLTGPVDLVRAVTV